MFCLIKHCSRDICGNSKLIAWEESLVSKLAVIRKSLCRVTIAPHGLEHRDIQGICGGFDSPTTAGKMSPPSNLEAKVEEVQVNGGREGGDTKVFVLQKGRPCCLEAACIGITTVPTPLLGDRE